MENLTQFIDETVKNNKVVLFMKGTPEAPRCGFSNRAAQILGTLGKPFKSVDVLSMDGLWETLRTYSDWPTMPQVYINGEFVGGCDIVVELKERGELDKLVA